MSALLLPSILLASLPMVLYLTVIWWLDRYDREPVWLVGFTFLWGAIGAITLTFIVAVPLDLFLLIGLFIGSHLIESDVSWLSGAMSPVLIAPLVEEPAKAVILLLIMWNRHFDNMTDGFVYGAAAGLGFGMTENFLYFSGVSDVGMWAEVVVIRTLYTAVMHATATAIVGAALGYARFRRPGALLLVGGAGLMLAMGVHALWNGLLVGDAFFDTQSSLTSINLMLLPLEVLCTFAIFQACLIEESCSIRRELAGEVEAGRIPPEHPAILSSWIRRSRRSWVPSGVPHEAYVKTATDLAMRKKQLRQLGERASPFYKDEVARLQEELGRLLRPR